MMALTLYDDRDGIFVTFVEIGDDDEWEWLADWVEGRMDGLRLLGVRKAEIRDRYRYAVVPISKGD
jgi:hypothetical protein